MILNLVLFILTLGWAINIAVKQTRYVVSDGVLPVPWKSILVDFALMLVVATWLMVRLS